MRRLHYLAATVLFLAAGVPARAGPTVRLECTADTSIVLHPDELNERHGGRTKIRIKGNQHIVALNFDARPIRGRTVESAVLSCRRAGEDIAGVTISTIQAEWLEAAANALTGGVPERDGWAWTHARFPAVCGGNSFSLVAQSKSRVVDGRYEWEVPPDLVHALATGAAHGLAVHEWDSDYSRNPTIFAREVKDHAPVLVVTLGGDEPKPGRPKIREAVHDGDPESIVVHVVAPDRGFVYDVVIGGRRLAPWNTPYVDPGELQAIPIRDLGLETGKKVTVEVAVRDRRGRRSPADSIRVTVPDPGPVPAAEVPPPAGEEPLPDLFAIPETDRVDESGRLLDDRPTGSLTSNDVFTGREVRLRSARGEVVGFQLVVGGDGPTGLGVFLEGLGCDVRRVVHVARKSGEGPRVPDPLVPFGRLDPTPGRPAVVHVAVRVPFDERREKILGEVRLADGRRLPVRVDVRKFSLPKRASFTCEMNSYGVPDSVKTYERLQEIAYDHRVHVNLLHYSHRTAAPGARKCNLDMRLADGRRMDERRYNAIRPGDRKGFWDDFATAFGGFLTGRHFEGRHRGPLPIPGFYLTFHESWPLSVRAHFDGNPDAREAFRDSPEYEKTFIAVFRDFVARARREGWLEAGLQVYLNNKGSIDDPARAPWILDEPTSYWDYRALAYYADLVRRAKGDHVPGPIRFRIDISRPQFTRGELRGKAGLWVVSSSAMRDYPRLLADRRRFTGEEMWMYGTAPSPEAGPGAVHAWVLGAYRLGATGIVPWQTIDRSGKGMRTADPLALFLFDGTEDGLPVVRGTLRLAAIRRAQQDIEYLNLLRERRSLTPDQMREFVDRWIPEGRRALREAAAALIEGGR